MVAGAVTAGAAVLYAVLGVLTWWRGVRDRKVAAALPETAFDPYYALLTASGSDLALWEAAAAALLRDDLVRVDRDGVLTVSVRGSDTAETPAHPIEAALLEHVRRAERPVVLSELATHTELKQHRDAFVQDQDAVHARWAHFRRDDLGCTAALVAALLGSFYTVLLAFFVFPHRGGLPQTLVEASLWAVVLGPVIIFLLFWIFALCWPERRNLLKEHCATLPHPAMEALDPGRRARLQTSARADSASITAERRDRATKG